MTESEAETTFGNTMMSGDPRRRSTPPVVVGSTRYTMASLTSLILTLKDGEIDCWRAWPADNRGPDAGMFYLQTKDIGYAWGDTGDLFPSSRQALTHALTFYEISPELARDLTF